MQWDRSDLKITAVPFISPLTPRKISIYSPLRIRVFFCNNLKKIIIIKAFKTYSEFPHSPGTKNPTKTGKFSFLSH